nr:hypothetical protein [Tanacetum cinerariifolium]
MFLPTHSKPIASPVNACDNHSRSELAKLTHVVNQQTSAVTTAMTAMLKQFQSNLPPAQVKAVEEICVTCEGAHPYYHCLAAGGNTFPEYRDNIQVYVLAATGNFNQGNPGYRPQGVANQMRPSVAQKKLEEKQIEEERVAKAKHLKLPVCYDDDDDEERSDSLDDNIISGLPPFSAITPDEPDLSESNNEVSSIDDDSFSIDDIDYVEASPPNSKLVNSEVMEIVIPEVGGIDDDILLTIDHDVLREKLRNVNLLISRIEALNANPTSSSDCKTKSSSTSLNSIFEETNTFDNSLPEFETFCFDVEEISSGSTTTYPDISLPEYEAFHDDHVKEISSGSPTT